MPSSPTIIGNFNATPLNTDFGDNAIGKLGKRRLEATNPPAPRTAGRAFKDFGAKVKDLATRALNTITPSGVRSNDKFRRGLQATSKQVGNLLGALSASKDHPVDGAKAKTYLGRVMEAMAPVRNRGGDSTQIFTHRLDTNVERMSLKELRELQAGVHEALAGELGQDTEMAPALQLIQSTVNRELSDRLRTEIPNQLTPLFEQALENVAHEGENPGQVDDNFKAMSREAERLLKAHGFAGTPEECLAAVKEALSHHLEQQTEQRLGDLGTVLDLVSSKHLVALRGAPSTLTGGVGSPDVQHAIQHAIGSRMDKAEQGFMQESSTLLMRDEAKPSELSGLTQELRKAARHFSTIDSHAKATGLEQGGAISVRQSELVEHLNKILAEPGPDFSGLSHDELYQFATALKVLGAKAPPSLEEAFLERTTALEKQYAESLGKVLDAFKEGEPEAILRALVEFTAMEDSACLAMQQLKGEIAECDSIIEWRRSMVENVTSKLSNEELEELHGKLGSKASSALMEGILEAGYDLAGHRGGDLLYPRLGEKLLAVGMNIERIKSSSELELDKREIAFISDSTPSKRSDLSPEGFKAIRTVFGVELGREKGSRLLEGVAPESLQESFKSEFEQPLKPSESNVARTEGGKSLGVAQIFRSDIGRATYRIQTGEDEFTPVINRTGWNNISKNEQDERTQVAVELLKELTGGDEEMVMLISQRAHQGMAAPIEFALNSPDSFVRLPDGTPVTLGGDEAKTYTFSKKEDGSIVMRYENRIEKARNYFNPSLERPVNIDPEGSHLTVSYELTFTPDKQVVISSPVSFSYAIKPTSWPKDYPKPQNTTEVVNSTHLELTTDFRSFLVDIRAEEPFDFLMAHKEFTKAPTLEQARELYDKYIRTGAPNLVTIDDGPYVENLGNTLFSDTAGELTGEEILKLFEKAVAESTGMLDGGLVTRFITANTVAI